MIRSSEITFKGYATWNDFNAVCVCACVRACASVSDALRGGPLCHRSPGTDAETMQSDHCIAIGGAGGS